MTRIQRERFADPAEYEQLKGSYVLDMALVQQAKRGITIMHPLPRVDEIAPEVDALRRARPTSGRWPMACRSAWRYWRW